MTDIAIYVISELLLLLSRSQTITKGIERAAAKIQKLPVKDRRELIEHLRRQTERKKAGSTNKDRIRLLELLTTNDG